MAWALLCTGTNSIVLLPRANPLVSQLGGTATFTCINLEAVKTISWIKDGNHFNCNPRNCIVEFELNRGIGTLRFTDLTDFNMSTIVCEASFNDGRRYLSSPKQLLTQGYIYYYYYAS